MTMMMRMFNRHARVTAYHSPMKRFATLSIGLMACNGAAAFSVAAGIHQRVCITTYDDQQQQCKLILQGEEAWSDEASLTTVAKRIATDLNVDFVSSTAGAGADDDGNSVEYSHVLDVVPFQVSGLSTYALGIRSLLDQELSPKNKKKNQRSRIGQRAGAPSPYIVDFCPSPDSPIGKRSKGSSGTSDLLIKAVGPARISNGGAKVYDLTAGFGQDSLLILENGASEVCMVERDPIVAALLQDALRRRNLQLQIDAENGDDVDKSGIRKVLKKLILKTGHGTDIAKSLSPSDYPHVCYLDPMFPPRTKSSAVKKNMAVLHSLLGSQEADDAATTQQETELLEAALLIAKTRVVVKRPINAPTLGDRKPSYDLRGSVNRWDVYITSQ
jgi:16S rRNA (guanine1516-N2)-methyltransferase